LGGRLEETGARAQRNGQTIIQLERPGAHNLKGERKIRVSSRGRVTKIKKLGKVRGPQVDVSARPVGTGNVVRSELLIDILDDARWNTMAGLALRYAPGEAY